MAFVDESILLLRTSIEEMYGRRFLTPKDFTFLSTEIYKRIHYYISPTTLKRLWGYLKNEKVSPSKTTLSILSLFVGYSNWRDFFFFFDSFLERQELCNRIIAAEVVETIDIKSAQILKLVWSPKGYCLVKCLGNSIFEVLDCKKTFLKKGDTFRCWIVAVGEPLYATNLMRNGMNLGNFVLGQKQGIRFC